MRAAVGEIVLAERPGHGRDLADCANLLSRAWGSGRRFAAADLDELPRQLAAALGPETTLQILRLARLFGAFYRLGLRRVGNSAA